MDDRSRPAHPDALPGYGTDHGPDPDLVALHAIEARDPNGLFTREPTAAEYTAHREWAIATYGRPLWVRYLAGGFGAAPSV